MGEGVKIFLVISIIRVLGIYFVYKFLILIRYYRVVYYKLLLSNFKCYSNMIWNWNYVNIVEIVKIGWSLGKFCREEIFFFFWIGCFILMGK